MAETTDARSRRDRIAVYRLVAHVRRRAAEPVPFGAVDSRWLGDIFQHAAQSMNLTSNELHVTYEAELPGVDEPLAGASFLVGESGVRGVMRLAAVGGAPTPRTEDDTQAGRVGVLLELPADRSQGLMAVYIPYRGRSVKAIIEAEFKRALADLPVSIDVRPVVPRAALLEAFDKGLLRLQLTRWQAPATSSMVGLLNPDDLPYAKEVVEVSPVERGRLLRPTKTLRDFLTRKQGDDEAVITFDDVEFHEGQVTVMLDGYERTFSLFEDPDERGHPLKVSVPRGDQDEHGPTAESIMAALRDEGLPAGRVHA